MKEYKDIWALLQAFVYLEICKPSAFHEERDAIAQSRRIYNMMKQLEEKVLSGDTEPAAFWSYINKEEKR